MTNKYSIRERVFIIWGGNLSLAEKVQKRLQSTGHEALVGGSVETNQTNYFLGPRVLEQMDSASHAIILADPSKVPDGETRKFRENLMFEWGYLLGRLPNQNVSVYLINCKRSELPTDLHGAFSALVPEPPNPAGISEARKETYQAKYICDSFVANYLEANEPSPYQVFSNWKYWKKFVEDQLSGRVAPEPKKLRRALLYAFLPIAYYGEDSRFVDQSLKRISLSGETSLHDFTLMKGISEFLRKARSSKAKSVGDFDEIKSRFSYVANPPDAELAILVRYIMGQCLMAESFHPEHSADERRRYRDFASKNFEEAINLLNDKDRSSRSGMTTVRMDTESKLILHSFVRSHLGKVKFFLDDRKDSINQYEICMEARHGIQQRLDLDGDDVVSELFLAETYIHKIRFLQVSDRLSVTELNEIERALGKLKISPPHQLKIAQNSLEQARNALVDGARLI